MRRAGHTEATVDLAKLAGHYGGVLCEVMKDNGEMAWLSDLFEIAEKFDMKIISIKDLIHYRLEKEADRKINRDKSGLVNSESSR